METCIEEAHLPRFGSPCLFQDLKKKIVELGIYKMTYLTTLCAILKVHKSNIFKTSQVIDSSVLSCHFHQSFIHTSLMKTHFL